MLSNAENLTCDELKEIILNSSNPLSVRKLALKVLEEYSYTKGQLNGVKATKAVNEQPTPYRETHDPRLSHWKPLNCVGMPIKYPNRSPEEEEARLKSTKFEWCKPRG